MRAVRLIICSRKKRMPLCETAGRSIGLKKSSSADGYEMKLLFADYEYKIA